MWQLYQKATKYGKPPSELVGIADEWTAYQFDNAVNFLGITVENALQERDEVGVKPNVEYRARYTLQQLLDPAFRLPRPQPEKPMRASGKAGAPFVSTNAELRALAMMAGSGIKFRKPRPGQGIQLQ